MKNNFPFKKIEKALITLAQCIDQLEQIHFQNAQIPERKNFRSREQLIKEILNDKRN